MLHTLEGGITNADGFVWNATGSLCGLINKAGGVTVYDASRNFSVSFEVPCSLKGIKAFYFSPLSTYMVAAERFEPKTPEAPNMSLWHVAGKTRIVEGRIRKIAGNSWPSMKWTDDEVCCCRVISASESPDPSVRESNILQVLNSKSSKTNNMDIPGVSLVEICPGAGRSYISVFISEDREKGRRPALKVYDFLSESSRGEIICHEFEYGIDTCAMKWSCNGDRLLVQAGSEIDESGSSYYGTSKLYIVNIEKAEMKMVSNETASPVHDFQWNPQGIEFCMVYGQTPFSIAVFDKNGVKIHDFGKSRKNTIRYSSVYGRFIALGGFGNLAGELEFFDQSSRRPFRLTRSECTVECEWAPNGRVLMTSSTHPRMRVDNSITFFRYTGEQICKLEFSELYSAKWKPMTSVVFPDTPASPRAFDLGKETEREPVKKAYRPPPSVTPSPEPSPPAPSPPPPQSIKIPCPDKDWYYRDPQSQVHGPYTRSVMNSWNKAGYFKPELPIRAGLVLPFVPLADMFPTDIIGPPFEQAMVVPKAWIEFKSAA